MATIPRIFTVEPLALQQAVELDAQASTHLIRVLRMQEGDQVRLFNGDGNEYLASITNAGKKAAQLVVNEISCEDPKVSLPLHLGQVISKGDRMDFTIQKATELGITEITPLWSERCDVKLKGERLEKKLDHWRKVAISACEQCGRNQVPIIHPPKHAHEWAATTESDIKLVLHTRDQKALSDLQTPNSIALLVGPEGGFTDQEVDVCIQHGFTGLTLGPRILRTETAALAALSLLQYLWGDF